MTRRFPRPARLAAAFLFAAVLAAVPAGCRRASDKSRENDSIVSGIGAHSLSGGGPDPRGAELFAIHFLRDLNEGTATSAMLTPQFKKVIAEPVFEADRAIGYSDDGAAAWLARFKGKMGTATITPHVAGTTSDAPGFTGTAAGGSPLRSRYELRIVNPGDGWRADWFVVGPDGGATSQNFSPGGPAGFAGMAFLEAVIAKDAALAEGLMTPALKARLAPPFDSDKARGYNRGILAAKLAELRGSSTGYAVERVDGTTVSAALTGSEKKAVTLSFAKGDRPWDWLVDRIEVR